MRKHGFLEYEIMMGMSTGGGIPRLAEYRKLEGQAGIQARLNGLVTNPSWTQFTWDCPDNQTQVKLMVRHPNVPVSRADLQSA